VLCEIPRSLSARLRISLIYICKKHFNFCVFHNADNRPVPCSCTTQVAMSTNTSAVSDTVRTISMPFSCVVLRCAVLFQRPFSYFVLRPPVRSCHDFFISLGVIFSIGFMRLGLAVPTAQPQGKKWGVTCAVFATRVQSTHPKRCKARQTINTRDTLSSNRHKTHKPEAPHTKNDPGRAHGGHTKSTRKSVQTAYTYAGITLQDKTGSKRQTRFQVMRSLQLSPLLPVS